MLRAVVTFHEGRLPDIPERIRRGLQGGCTATGRAVQEEYEANAPRDTSAMAHSVYIVNADGFSDYSERTSLADALNPKGTVFYPVPPPVDVNPSGIGTRVAVAMTYAPIVEYGYGRGRNSSPRPTFTNAGEMARRVFGRLTMFNLREHLY